MVLYSLSHINKFIITNNKKLFVMKWKNVSSLIELILGNISTRTLAALIPIYRSISTARAHPHESFQNLKKNIASLV